MFMSQSNEAVVKPRKLNERARRWAEHMAQFVASRALDTDFPDKKIKVCVQSTLAPRDVDGKF